MCFKHTSKTLTENFSLEYAEKWQSPNSKKFIKIILFSSACIVISMFDLHTVYLKSFCSFICPLNVFQTYIKNINRKLFPGICWKKWQSPNSKKLIKIIWFSSACINVWPPYCPSEVFLYFMCPLNVFQTYIKNFNRKLFPGGWHMQDRRTDTQKCVIFGTFGVSSQEVLQGG